MYHKIYSFQNEVEFSICMLFQLSSLEATSICIKSLQKKENWLHFPQKYVVQLPVYNQPPNYDLALGTDCPHNCTLILASLWEDGKETIFTDRRIHIFLQHFNNLKYLCWQVRLSVLNGLSCCFKNPFGVWPLALAPVS